MAFAMAVALWFFAVNRYTKEITEVVDLQVLIPSGFTLLNQSTEDVIINLKGPQKLIDKISDLIRDKKINARCQIPSDNINESEDTIKRAISISKDNLNLPGEIKLASVYPERVDIEISRLEKKYLKVHIKTKGEPEPSYEIKNEFVYPREVLVTGPANILKLVSEIETIPIDISGITVDKNKTFPWVIDIEQGVKITRNDKTELIPVKCEKQVRIWFSISELQETKTLDKVKINLLSPTNFPYKVRLQDEYISLELKGPKLVIDKLIPEDVIAYVNVGLLKPPGPYNQPVLLNLPKGVEVSGKTAEIHVDLQE